MKRTLSDMIIVLGLFEVELIYFNMEDNVTADMNASCDNIVKIDETATPQEIHSKLAAEVASIKKVMDEIETMNLHISSLIDFLSN